MFGIQPYGIEISGFRFERMTGRPQQHPQIVVGVRMFWVDSYRSPVRVDCQIEPVVRLEDDTEIAVPVRLLGDERNASLDERNGVLVSPFLMREHAGVVQGSRMIGHGLQYL